MGMRYNIRNLIGRLIRLYIRLYLTGCLCKNVVVSLLFCWCLYQSNCYYLFVGVLIRLIFVFSWTVCLWCVVYRVLLSVALYVWGVRCTEFCCQLCYMSVVCSVQSFVVSCAVCLWCVVYKGLAVASQLLSQLHINRWSYSPNFINITD